VGFYSGGSWGSGPTLPYGELRLCTLPFLTDCRYLGQKEEIYLICLHILLRVLNIVEMVKVVTTYNTSW